MSNVYDLALQIEEDGRQYYLDQAASSKDVQLKKLFTMLADDEKRHHQIILKMKDNDNSEYISVSDDTVKQAKDIFANKVESRYEFEAELNHLEAYEHAIELEVKTHKLYSELAEKAETEEARKVFTKLAKEERGHQIILENLMVLIRNPLTWVESAEFNHMEEY